MNKILITAIGGDIGQSVARVLRETYTETQLFGSDVRSEHGGHSFVDTYTTAPLAAAPTYLDWLCQYVDQQDIDLVIPVSEFELERLAHLDVPQELAQRLLNVSAKVLSIGLDKLETTRFLADCAIAQPWAKTDPDQLSDQDFPCIFKPRQASGSRLILTCQDQEEARLLAKKHAHFMFQQLLPDAEQEITCAVFRSKQGQTHVLQLRRKLVGGATGWAEVVHHPEIQAQCTRIAEATELCGSLNVQLRLTADGPRIFEINPRFSSTVLMRHRMGFSDLIWTIQDQLGQAFTVDQPPIGSYGFKTHDYSVFTPQQGRPTHQA